MSAKIETEPIITLNLSSRKVLGFALMIAQESWENLAADDVLSKIFAKLREEPYSTNISRELYAEVKSAWSICFMALPDNEFVSEFVEAQPDLFIRLKEAISTIFREAKQFETCRNPDLKPRI
jgi:hypothetical protein